MSCLVVKEKGYCHASVKRLLKLIGDINAALNIFTL